MGWWSAPGRPNRKLAPSGSSDWCGSGALPARSANGGQQLRPAFPKAVHAGRHATFRRPRRGDREMSGLATRDLAPPLRGARDARFERPATLSATSSIRRSTTCRAKRTVWTRTRPASLTSPCAMLRPDEGRPAHRRRQGLRRRVSVARYSARHVGQQGGPSNLRPLGSPTAPGKWHHPPMLDSPSRHRCVPGPKGQSAPGIRNRQRGPMASACHWSGRGDYVDAESLRPVTPGENAGAAESPRDVYAAVGGDPSPVPKRWRNSPVPHDVWVLVIRHSQLCVVARCLTGDAAVIHRSPSLLL